MLWWTTESCLEIKWQRFNGSHFKTEREREKWAIPLHRIVELGCIEWNAHKNWIQFSTRLIQYMFFFVLFCFVQHFTFFYVVSLPLKYILILIFRFHLNACATYLMATRSKTQLKMKSPIKIWAKKTEHILASVEKIKNKQFASAQPIKYKYLWIWIEWRIVIRCSSTYIAQTNLCCASHHIKYMHSSST